MLVRNERIRKPMNKGYSDAGASWTKNSMKGFNAFSGSPHEDIDFNQYTLRTRARMLYMSTPVATSAINTNKTNVIGIGLRLQPVIDRKFLKLSDEKADAVQEQISREFDLWASNKRVCDACGINDFYELQQIALASSLLNGDVFALMKFQDNDTSVPYKTQIQLIEADRCSTPADHYYAGGYTTGKNPDNGNYIYDGVEVDRNGKVVAYHFSNIYPYEVTDKQLEWIRVPAFDKKTDTYNVVHCTTTDRPEQYRGNSILAPVIEQLLQLRRYTDSELLSAVVESFFTAFVTTTSEPDVNPFEGAEGETPDDNPSDYELGPGTVNYMKPGEAMEFADPKRPANGFESFVEAICTQIGAALDIPMEVLLKKFDSNYSASRASLMEAWKAFKMRRTWFVNDFCNPIYEAFFSEAVARGRIDAPGFFDDPLIKKAYLRANWTGPAQGQLDPVKEVEAEILKVKNGFETFESAATNLNGSSWENNVNILKREYNIKKDLDEIKGKNEEETDVNKEDLK